MTDYNYGFIDINPQTKKVNISIKDINNIDHMVTEFDLESDLKFNEEALFKNSELCKHI